MKMFLLLIAAVVLVSGCTQSGNAVNTNTAPDFTLTDIQGTTYSLHQFRGKPVVFAFFASWCTPCIQEAETLKKLDTGDDFTVFQIGVDERETREDLQRFKDQHGREDWIVGFGSDVAELYNVKSLDTTIIVDATGTIVYRDNGIPAAEEELRKWLL